MNRKLLRPHFGLNKSPTYCGKRVLAGAYGCAVFILFITLVISAPTAVLADDEEYLNQLAAEAENTNSQTKNTKKLDAAELKQFNQMEKMLANERPTTYKFYKKLTNEKKQKVFKVHISKNKLSLTSKTVMDLYFNN